MPSPRTPEQIAVTLAETPRGRNVRALLLRLADGDSIGGASTADLDYADEAKLLVDHDDLWPTLTDLGRAVGEACRPKPWVTAKWEQPWHDGGVYERCVVQHVDRELAFTVDNAPGDEPGESLGERVARLLTADDLARVKTFEVEP